MSVRYETDREVKPLPKLFWAAALIALTAIVAVIAGLRQGWF